MRVCIVGESLCILGTILTNGMSTYIYFFIINLLFLYTKYVYNVIKLLKSIDRQHQFDH